MPTGKSAQPPNNVACPQLHEQWKVWFTEMRDAFIALVDQCLKSDASDDNLRPLIRRARTARRQAAEVVNAILEKDGHVDPRNIELVGRSYGASATAIISGALRRSCVRGRT